jgi:hypothetical protein
MISGRRFLPAIYQLFDFNPRMRARVQRSVMRDPRREGVIVFDHGGADRNQIWRLSADLALTAAAISSTN